MLKRCKYCHELKRMSRRRAYCSECGKKLPRMAVLQLSSKDMDKRKPYPMTKDRIGRFDV